MIEQAARGEGGSSDAFARRYAPAVRAYLAARWKGTPRLQDLDDAVQAVFVECFKPGGLLSSVDRDRAAGFRAYLFGAVRHVALRMERGRAVSGRETPEDPAGLDQLGSDESRLSVEFDRAWARGIMREAAARQREQAAARGEAAFQRVELLRLRFEEGLPIRTIAERWRRDPADLHHDYATARREFRQALLEVMSFYQPGEPALAHRACVELLSLLA
jgi:RNA polymerase sigma-70 factor (ECF subfamily)